MNSLNSISPTAPTLAQKYAAKELKNADYLHSSGYAKAQSGENIGSAATATTFKARQAIEDQRKYVKKYRNARILQGLRGFEKAKTYVPRVEKSANVPRGRGTLTPEQPSSDLSSTPSTASAMSARAQLPTGPTISSPPSHRVPPVKL